MKNTAVEWLTDEVNKFNTVLTKEYVLDLLKQAKEIEREQIQLAHASRCSFIGCEANSKEQDAECECGRKYYERTFNK